MTDKTPEEVADDLGNAMGNLAVFCGVTKERFVNIIRADRKAITAEHIEKVEEAIKEYINNTMIHENSNEDSCYEAHIQGVEYCQACELKRCIKQALKGES